jgi:hypothetical protein
LPFIEAQEMFWIDGRISWPVVLAVVFSTVTILATDFAWRTIQAPLPVIVGVAALLLLAGNAAIFIRGARPR